MFRWFGIVMAVLLLSGCGVKFAYNNLDLITPWYLDDYIELNSEQRQIFDQRLQQLHVWHRDQELPQYQQTLSDLHQHLYEAELDPQRIGSAILQFRGHWDTLIQQATPAIIELSRTLSDTQVSALFGELEERNQKRLKRADTPAEHKRDSLELVEKWMGQLTKQQRAWVEDFAQNNPDLTQKTVAAHRAFQAQLSEQLAQRSTEGFESALTELLSDALGQSSAGQTLERLRKQQLEARVELFVQLWRSASDNQKRKVRSRVQGYIDDIEAMMKG